jgi:uncharacterized circularly permuted ATP-grasp superfamily protein
MLENREILKRTFLNYSKTRVKPVYNYTHFKRYTGILTEVEKPTIVLTGIFNSAYFEHSYLAQQMGELVEGKDLIVKDDIVFMITTAGLQRVDVIYRRVDDDFIDPLVFNKHSLLGTPGLFKAYLKGNVVLVNAPELVL